MTAHMESAPNREGRDPKTVSSGGLNCLGNNTEHAKHQVSVEELDDIDADIEAAEAFERVLALKAYRVRKLILTLKIKRDALADLGAVLTERRAP